MTAPSVTAVDVATPAVEKSRPGRIASLDVVRGVFLLVSVACEAVLAPRGDALTHARWASVHPIDLVFPLFVTLSGCGLAFAYRNRVGWVATVRRSLVLLVVGLIYMAITTESAHPATLKVTGPLQVYAVLVLLIGVLHLVARGVRAWLLITLLAAGAQLVMLLLFQAHCPGNELLPTCNPSRTIDFAVFGTQHIYHFGQLGHDPEGIPSIIGAFVTASAGVTAGHLALTMRGTRRAPLYLLGLALGLAAIAAATYPTVPMMKRLWTTPFALGIGALGVLILAVGMAVMDSPASPTWTRLRARLAWPLIALGRNSLLVYFGSHIAVFILLMHGGTPSWAEQAAERVDFIGYPRASFVIANVIVWLVIAAVLHRRRIYLRP
jgi:predicted acyltransferase